MARGKANGTGGVIFVNLLLGWTVVGWFLAFVWACTGQTNADMARADLPETYHAQQRWIGKVTKP